MYSEISLGFREQMWLKSLFSKPNGFYVDKRITAETYKVDDETMRVTIQVIGTDLEAEIDICKEEEQRKSGYTTKDVVIMTAFSLALVVMSVLFVIWIG